MAHFTTIELILITRMFVLIIKWHHKARCNTLLPNFHGVIHQCASFFLLIHLFSPILLLPVIMLGCTLWHPAPGRELQAHNGMEQQAGRCWFHSGRTQMAGKHSSACGTGLSPTQSEKQLILISISLLLEGGWGVEASRPSDETHGAPRPEALTVTDMPPL